MFVLFVHEYAQNQNLEAEVRRLRHELQQFNASMGRESVRHLLSCGCFLENVFRDVRLIPDIE